MVAMVKRDKIVLVACLASFDGNLFCTSYSKEVETIQFEEESVGAHSIYDNISSTTVLIHILLSFRSG